MLLPRDDSVVFGRHHERNAESDADKSACKRNEQLFAACLFKLGATASIVHQGRDLCLHGGCRHGECCLL